jgi:hypothetical protein
MVLKTMAFTLDLTTMIVLAVIALAAIYILMRFFGNTPGEEEDDTPEPRVAERPDGMSDDEFIDSYTGPMLEDALETMETAVGSIKSGIEYYKRPAWEAAGEEFHSAARSIDGAAAHLKEVLAMVENPGSKPSRLAKARLEECRRLRVLTITMEEACDARVEGKDEEAKKLEVIMPELERMASTFTK